MQIGVVGLGKMGAGIARRLLRAGVRVVGYDRDPKIGACLHSAGMDLADSLTALVERLQRPRIVWLMLPAGPAVEEVVSELAAKLGEQDVVIDGGNSHYRDSMRRHRDLEGRGLRFLDVGTSGGIRGEAAGYCLMVGGREETVLALRPLFEVLSADAGRGWARVGGGGAGHFTKMVHNGIEYGMMQALAEGFALLDAKEGLGLEAERIAEVWRHGSVVRSWLLDLLAERLADPQDLSRIAASVEDSGEGRWAVEEAFALQVPAPVITASLLQRIRSRVESSYADRLLAALRQSFGGHPVRPADPNE